MADRKPSSGGPAGCEIAWNVSYAEPDPLDAAQRLPILRGVHGRVQPGRLLAILGPSGAGKTSLLNCLSGKLKPEKYDGQVLYGGRRCVSERPPVAFVEQADMFLDTLTVGEHMDFHARLRLHALPTEQRKRRVADVLAQLGMSDNVRKRIGILSGGEKKRLSICEELLTSPGAILLDEPTSQLDSHMAATVVKVLQDLAQAGTTVVFTIHQPSSSLFQSFDQVLLLAKGACVYQGPASGVVAHLAGRGHVCPPAFNAAEFALDVLSKETFEPQADRWECAAPDAPVLVHEPPYAPWWVEYACIVQRTFLQRSRQRLQTRLNVVNTVLISLMAGSVYLGVGQREQGEQAARNRVGAVFFLFVHPVFTAIFETTMPLIMDAGTLTREYKNKRLYRVSSFYFARTTGELPLQALFPCLYVGIMYWMIGFDAGPAGFALLLATLLLACFTGCSYGYFLSTLSTDFEIGMSLAVVVLVSLFLFSGMITDTALVPAPLQWIKYVSLFKYAFDAGIIPVFEGADVTCADAAGECTPVRGDDVLRTYGIADPAASLQTAFAMLVILSICARALAFVRLYVRYVLDDDLRALLRAPARVEPKTKAVSFSASKQDERAAEPKAEV